MKLVRKNIREVQEYIAGKPIEETKRELGLRRVIKLASNENPIGSSPKAVQAIVKAARSINRYPDSQSFYLRDKLSRSLKLRPDNLVFGNGSDELIDIVIKTFVEDDENIVTADNTFVEYGIIGKVNNKRVITVPLDNSFRFDLKAMRKRINGKTKLIFIANPNNPTGTYVKRRELELFLASLPKSAITVLDEAYDTFIDVDDYPYGIDYLKKHNVIALKTFSKGYGLAGLRIGYAIVPESLSPFMERGRQPFNVNILAQAGAAAAIGDKKFLRETRRLTLEGKYYLYGELEKLGFNFVPSVTNFILVDVKRDCKLVFRQLLKLGIIVRDMKQYKMDTFIRVSIGTMAENRAFVSALKRVLRGK